MTRYKKLPLPKGYDIKIVTTVEEIETIRSTWETMQWHPNADIDHFLTVIDSQDDILQPYIITLYKNGTSAAMLIGRIENRRIELKIGYKVSFIKVDFPLPETPVIQISCPNGNLIVRFFKL